MSNKNGVTEKELKEELLQAGSEMTESIQPGGTSMEGLVVPPIVAADTLETSKPHQDSQSDQKLNKQADLETEMGTETAAGPETEAQEEPIIFTPEMFLNIIIKGLRPRNGP